MHAVKLSSDFKIEIPQELRDRLELNPEQGLYLFERDGQIRIARRRIEQLFGIAPGIKWKDDYRDHNDRY